MRIVFMGTPDFAVPTLARIAADGHTVAAVYTRAPARAGRGMGLTGIPPTAMARVQITGGTALFAGSGADVTATNGFLLADGVIHEMDMPVGQMSFLQVSGTCVLRMLIR